jgi:hypothetical protein
MLLSGTPICKVLFVVCFRFGLHDLSQVILRKDWNHTWGRNIHEVELVAANMEVDFLSSQYLEMCISRPDTWPPDSQPSICSAVRDSQSDAVCLATHA